MEWREDLGPARAGNAGARERVREYLTPFAHGVALAWAPHHLADRLVPRILDEAMKTLGGVDDESVGVHVMNVARRMAREVSPGAIEEQGTTQASLLEARQTLSRLRALPEQARERFFLRVVEGIPGPELSQVVRVAPGELRAELERCAAEAARAFGQGQSFVGDEYLWELTGNPPALLARLEMQLPALRFDPTSSPMSEAATAGTFQELAVIGSAPMKPLLFDEFESTNTGAVAPAPAGHRAPAPVGENPFNVVRTIAATDLPAEARGSLPMVPWQDPGKSGRQPQLSPRPAPATSSPEGELSSKSNTDKSASSKSGRMAPMPPRAEATKDAPILQEPDVTDASGSALARPALGQVAQAQGQGELVTRPESMLGKPTMVMPLSAAIVSAPPTSTMKAIEQGEPRIGVVPTATSVLDAPALKGTQPLVIGSLLAIAAVAIYSASLFAIDRKQRANWALAQVVVAAEELGIGATVTLENVALRAVPEPFQGSGVVKGEMMDFILDQQLAVPVQMGDPLFMSQFVSMRTKDQRLAKKIVRRTRGFTIATTTTGSVGQWVKPGDLVDVIVTLPGKEAPLTNKVERRAVTLLQKVPVLATGRIADDIVEATMDARERAYGDVTLLLSAEEAEALTLGAALGRVKLTLRNGEDLEEDRNLDGAFTDSDTLLDGSRQKAVESKRRKIIEVIRNAKTNR